MIRVKCCHNCRRSWTLEEWGRLGGLAADDNCTPTRQCDRCGTVLSLDEAHEATLEQRTPSERAWAIVDASRSRRRRSRILLGIAVIIVLFAAVFAARLWVL